MGADVEPEWVAINRAHWDEKVPVHLASEFYDQSALRRGEGRLYPIEELELPRIATNGWQGLRVLHLQCHFGADSLVLAQRGAEVVGIDFSMPAIRAARELAAEVGLTDRTRFVCADLYDARHRLPDPEGFDVVYTTWGTIGWLPDTAEWARIIAWFLKPGGRLYFADGHPTAFVFDDAAGTAQVAGTAFPLPAYGYFRSDGLSIEEEGDYADTSATIANARTVEWMHPLGRTITDLVDAGLAIDFVHEHDAVPWQIFAACERDEQGMWRMPGEALLPLGMSLGATRRAN